MSESAVCIGLYCDVITDIVLCSLFCGKIVLYIRNAVFMLTICWKWHVKINATVCMYNNQPTWLYLHNLISVQSTCSSSARFSSAVTITRPSLSSSLQITNSAVLDMHHLTCGISSLLHSVNLILFTVLLVHLILRISPHHSHHLYSHHLSLPRPFFYA